jgi:hypothetical protein
MMALIIATGSFFVSPIVTATDLAGSSDRKTIIGASDGYKTLGFASIHYFTIDSSSPSEPPGPHSRRLMSSPFRIKSANWLQVEIRWPNINGATEYMLRVKTKEYPTTQASGTLVYQGTALAALDFKGINKRYTLFYKDASDEWTNAYIGHY